uniref:Uncharacterized protein n=1 Tax=Parascaris univalens TaxID=6257 RepID=A0A915B227_PARUN
MLGLKEGAEWSDAEEADILQQAISLCSKKIRKGGKSITTKQAPTKPVDEAALRPDSCNSTHELNEEVSTGITVRQRITPVVSIEGDEIVLRIPVRVEQRVGHLEHQLKQPSQEANCERDAIKKVTSRRNRISRIKHDKSSNCFTDDGGGIPVSKGEPHKRLCRIHGKGVKVIHSKQHRRSKSAPYKLSAAAVNKDQLGENKEVLPTSIEVVLHVTLNTMDKVDVSNVCSIRHRKFEYQSTSCRAGERKSHATSIVYFATMNESPDESQLTSKIKTAGPLMPSLSHHTF